MADATIPDLVGASGLLLRHNSADTAKIWADSSKTIAITDGATVENWQPSSPSVLTSELLKVTSGPTYRANYNSTGYPGVEFARGSSSSGSILSVASSGLSASRYHLIAVITPLNGSNTAMPIGRGSDVFGFSLYFPTSTTAQIFSNGAVVGSTIPVSGKIAAILTLGTGMNVLDCGPGCYGTGGSVLNGSLSDRLTLGNLYPTLNNFFSSCVIHDLLWIDGAVEYGQVVRAKKLVATQWGVSDPNATPQASAGGLQKARNMTGGFSA